MPICGLLGKKLSHSYSPLIHNMIGNRDYFLFEKSENEIETFLREGDWYGLNVTIPYKKALLLYMDKVGETARKTGSINTIIKDENGRMTGENTDVFGFEAMVRHAGMDLSGRKVLILGNGGVCPSVCAALETFNARPTIISRRGENHYNNLDRHRDAAFIVNTTPLGMYPNNGQAAVDLKNFPDCKGVLDLIYNPARTALLLQAEELGIPYENGLYMLIAQAKKSAEYFLNKSIPDSEIDRIDHVLSGQLTNIILIGMPGCGKTTLAQEIGALTGREVFDSDEEIFRKYGQSPEVIITSQGEAAFRKIETAVLAELGKKSGVVIATGGGVVTRIENYPLLHQNGTIVWLQRNIAELTEANRPISQQSGIENLYAQRAPLYRKFADVIFDLDQNASAETLIEQLDRSWHLHHAEPQATAANN